MVDPEPITAVPFADKTKLDAEVERVRQRMEHEPQVTVPQRPAAAETRIIDVEVTCRDCGNGFKTKALHSDDGPRLVPKLCNTCRTAFDAETAKREADAARKMAVEAWEAICPPLYRETDAERLAVIYDQLPRVLEWEPGSQGLGLTGTSGAGKTRAMFLLLHRLHFGGHKIVATTAKRFEQWCHQMFDKNDAARTKIKEARKAKILFIDDIGKEKYTERVESEFYDLIEHRTSNLLPILWTANATGQQLVKMMGEDRGTPIVRRLREFSTIISV